MEKKRMGVYEHVILKTKTEIKKPVRKRRRRGKHSEREHRIRGGAVMNPGDGGQGRPPKGTKTDVPRRLESPERNQKVRKRC